VLLAVVFLPPADAFSQDLKRVKLKDKKSGAVEVFTVLKSERNTRHGEYVKASANGTVVTEGRYRNGKKDSVWSHYNYRGTLLSRGAFEDDRRTGVWEYFSDKGALLQRYNFTSHELLYTVDASWDSTQRYPIKVGNDTMRALLDRPAFPLGSNEAFSKHLIRATKYPPAARKDGIAGTAVVGFYVSESGAVEDIVVIRDPGGGCGAEAVRVLNAYPHGWIPALMNGKPVAARVVLPITFVLAE
jgi:TonB family protein